MYKKFLGPAAVIAMAIAFAGSSYASSQVVNATDVIYAAGGNASAATFGGTTPTAISVTGQASVTFGPTTGTITLNNSSGNQINDADGVKQSGTGGPASVTSSATGVGNLSGVSTTAGSGYLTAVFINGTAGATAQPATIGGVLTAPITPLLNQVFVIGDGLTGDGTGTNITIPVPTNATALYLGISDACGYTGAPSCYGDNAGTFTMTYVLNPVVVNTTPVPPSIWLTLIGLACGGLYLGFNGLRAAGRA
jgi:hypothetical protein